MTGFIAAQAQNPTFQQYDAIVSHTASKFYIESSGLVVIKSTICGATHTVVAKSLQGRLPYLVYHPTLTEYTVQSRACSSTIVKYCCSHMPNDAYRTADGF